MASCRHHQRPLGTGKKNLLAAVLREHEDVLLRQARHNSRLDQDAEDALGDACVQFLVHFPGETVEEARRWMLVVVRRCAWEIDRRRRERRAIVGELSIGTLDDFDGAALGGRWCDADLPTDAVGDLVAALGRLKPDEARALLLVAAGYRWAEVASIEGWTYTKAKRCIYEGRRRLREILEEGGEG